MPVMHQFRENCPAHTRILVPRSRCDEVVNAVTDLVSSLKVGPHDPSTFIDPVVRKDRHERVRFTSSSVWN